MVPASQTDDQPTLLGLKAELDALRGDVRALRQRLAAALAPSADTDIQDRRGPASPSLAEAIAPPTSFGVLRALQSAGLAPSPLPRDPSHTVFIVRQRGFVLFVGPFEDPRDAQEWRETMAPHAWGVSAAELPPGTPLASPREAAPRLASARSVA